jgi:DNA-binding XRE family transcriptional regulator
VNAEKFKEIRINKLKMSQGQLARALGCHRVTIWRLERGDSPVSRLLDLAMRSVKPIGPKPLDKPSHPMGESLCGSL